MRGSAPRRRSAALAIGLLVAAPAASRAEETPYGLVRLPPTMISRAAPLRRALVIAPGETDPAPGSDAAAYRDTLRLLGFEVTLVTGSTRPELDAALRAAATPAKGDLALFIVGRIVPGDRDLFLLPADVEFTEAPLLPTDGLRLGTVLERLLPQGEGEMVAVAEGCRDQAGGAACGASLGDLPAAVSLAVISGGDGDARDLAPLMEKEGLPFADLVATLQHRSTHSGPEIVATTQLSHTFTFLPTGFLAGLPLACNNADPTISAEALRHAPPLGALVLACEEAARRYDFSPYFRTRLTVVREQRAAQQALACEGVAAAAYLEAYPDGRYRKAVAENREDCAPKPPSSAPGPPNFPAAPPNPLQAGAAAAVADYFRRHDYDQGSSFGELVRLYPPQIREGRAVVARNDHLRDLGAWYGEYDSVRFEVVPDTLDASGCLKKEDCLMRGSARVRTLKSGDSRYTWVEERFALRFDLSASLVLAECGVAGPASAKPEACE